MNNLRNFFRLRRDFEFVVEMPIEVASEKLLDYVETYNFLKRINKYPRLYIEYSNQEIISSVKGQALLNAVTLIAYLTEENFATNVKGYAVINFNTIILSWILFVLVGLLWDFPIVLMLFILPGTAFTGWLNSRYERRLIIIRLQEILTEKKKKHH